MCLRPNCRVTPVKGEKSQVLAKAVGDQTSQRSAAEIRSPLVGGPEFWQRKQRSWEGRG